MIKAEKEHTPKENAPLFQRVGILGLGLLGGSLAKALRFKAHIPSLVAMDKDQAAGDAAIAEGVIDAFAVPEEGLSLFRGCDVLILCTPIEVIQSYLPELRRQNISIITDVSSVKTPVMETVDLPNFIGGHPMAGSERRGYACSRDSLFENAMYVLCLGDSCQVPANLLKRFEALIRSIGASPEYMTPEEHDRRVAVISHLPHLAASGLSLTAAGMNDEQLTRMAAGGFRDITRIASADPGLWTGICKESAPFLIPVLDEYMEHLVRVRHALVDQNQKILEDYFSGGAFFRNRLPPGGRGALEAAASITVYLEDKPGALAVITALLSDNAINIRNMNIRNFRAYEGGQLLLVIQDGSQAEAAYRLLKEAGYECE